MKTVSFEQLLQEINQAVGPSPPGARPVLEAAVEQIRGHLAAGEPVELASDITVQPSAGVAVAEAAEGKVYKILLVVGAVDFFTNTMVQRLTGPLTTVAVAEGPDAAWKKVESDDPDLVIIDSTVEQPRSLVSRIKETLGTSLIAVLLIYPEGADPNAVAGLKACEDESLVEPFELDELVGLVEDELTRKEEEEAFFDHEIHFQLQTAEQHVEQANDLIARLVDQVKMSDESKAAVSVAFREAIDNAARHGNKNQENRIIDVIYLLDKEKATITVEDEGDGFDTEMFITRGREGNAVAAARERNQAGRVGGLGIMLMLKCLDDLEYNAVGNLIKLTKFVA
ncbi:MAG: ATP-binding protein [Planctomycetes bacterium]|nr:ATP-binding protein [Planctomycetota bacterium]